MYVLAWHVRLAQYYPNLNINIGNEYHANKPPKLIEVCDKQEKNNHIKNVVKVKHKLDFEKHVKIEKEKISEDQKYKSFGRKDKEKYKDKVRDENKEKRDKDRDKHSSHKSSNDKEKHSHKDKRHDKDRHHHHYHKDRDKDKSKDKSYHHHHHKSSSHKSSSEHRSKHKSSSHSSHKDREHSESRKSSSDNSKTNNTNNKILTSVTTSTVSVTNICKKPVVSEPSTVSQKILTIDSNILKPKQEKKPQKIIKRPRLSQSADVLGDILKDMNKCDPHI